MHDGLADGRRFRPRNVLASVTRAGVASVASAVDPSLPGQRVVRLRDQVLLWQGTPTRLPRDNGPACTGQALDAWA